jgi:glycosyltransferase involved in cell wall biosynthesis
LVRTPVLTTIHGFSSPKILPVYEKYNDQTSYVSISDPDRSERLRYVRTIHHGIELEQFDCKANPTDNLLFFGRIHPDKGTRAAIDIARGSEQRLIIAGIIQDQDYFEAHVRPHIDDNQVQYIGSVGPAERNRVRRLQTASDGHRSLVGNDGWLKRGGKKAQVDQQPVDVMGLVRACAAAYLLSGKEE